MEARDRKRGKWSENGSCLQSSFLPIHSFLFYEDRKKCQIRISQNLVQDSPFCTKVKRERKRILDLFTFAIFVLIKWKTVSSLFVDWERSERDNRWCWIKYGQGWPNSTFFFFFFPPSILAIRRVCTDSGDRPLTPFNFSSSRNRFSIQNLLGAESLEGDHDWTIAGRGRYAVALHKQGVLDGAILLFRRRR